MYIIEDVLVHEDIFSECFSCHLEACKGACCVDGEFGAPLDNEEMKILKEILPDVLPFVDKSGAEILLEKGPVDQYRDDDHEFPGTILREDGACAFIRTSENGTVYCGIESAWRAGTTHFKKPISCELYPIRVTERPEMNFTAVNYDRWEICNPACIQGKKSELRLYQFLKDALIRKFSEPFYRELDQAAQHFLSEKETDQKEKQ